MGQIGVHYTAPAYACRVSLKIKFRCEIVKSEAIKGVIYAFKSRALLANFELTWIMGAGPLLPLHIV